MVVDKCLAIRVCEGLRPVMPDSAPEEYKKLAEQCCAADPDKRPDSGALYNDIYKLTQEIDKDIREADNSDGNAWNIIYHKR